MNKIKKMGGCEKLKWDVEELNMNIKYTTKAWHEKFEARLKKVLLLTKKQAHEQRMAGMDEFDYEKEPEDWADEEAELWYTDDPLVNN